MSNFSQQFFSLLYLPWVIFKENILGKRGVRILMFHSIASSHVEGIDNQKVVEITPRVFRRLLVYLVPRYRFISLEELAELIQQGIKLPKRTLVLTFDDGYANNFTQVLPLLKEFNLRATIFMPSSFIGKPGYLTPDLLKQLITEHIEIGGHTVNHPVLSLVSEEVAYQEISQGKEELELMLEKPIKTFAYPKGKVVDYNAKTVELVKKAGFLTACTTIRGTNTLKTPLMELRRIGVDGRDNFFSFWLKLHGGYDWTSNLSRFKAWIKRKWKT